VAELSREVAALRGLLCDRLASVSSALSGGFPAVADNLWLGRDEADAVGGALLPKLERTRRTVADLMFEVCTLEVALASGVEPVTLANLMPRHWADFIRNSPVEDVKPIGTTPLGLPRI